MTAITVFFVVILWFIGKALFLLGYLAFFKYPSGDKEKQKDIWTYSDIWFIVLPVWIVLKIKGTLK